MGPGGSPTRSSSRLRAQRYWVAGRTVDPLRFSHTLPRAGLRHPGSWSWTQSPPSGDIGLPACVALGTSVLTGADGLHDPNMTVVYETEVNEAGLEHLTLHRSGWRILRSIKCHHSARRHSIGMGSAGSSRPCTYELGDGDVWLCHDTVSPGVLRFVQSGVSTA